MEAISGERDWAFLSFVIPEGDHVLAWVYHKDGMTSAGQDCAWVDLVSYVPDPPKLPAIEMIGAVVLAIGCALVGVLTLRSATQASH